MSTNQGVKKMNKIKHEVCDAVMDVRKLKVRLALLTHKAEDVITAEKLVDFFEAMTQLKETIEGVGWRQE